MPDLAGNLRTIRRDLRAEYLQSHDWPWMIGFTGGKDSALILHLVVECLQAIPSDERRLPDFLVCNDSFVESPVPLSEESSWVHRRCRNTKLLGILR